MAMKGRVETGDFLRAALDREFGLRVGRLLSHVGVFEINKVGSGFVYCVSVFGTTGAREGISVFLKPFLKRVREQVKLPLAAGFGFSQPSQIKSVKFLADGIIVGSAFIDAFNRGKTSEEKISFLKAKVKELKEAL